MDEFKHRTTSLLQDLQNREVGPDWDARAILQALQGHPLSAISTKSPVPLPRDDQLERGSAPASNYTAVTKLPSILKRSTAPQSPNSEQNSTPWQSSEVSLDERGMVGRALPSSTSDTGASRRGLSVRFADSEYKIDSLPSSPTVFGSPRERVPSHFHSPDSHSLQDGESALHCSHDIAPILVRSCVSDPCTPNDSPGPETYNTRKSRFFNRDGAKSSNPRSRTQSNSFSFPLEVRTELGSCDWLEDSPGQMRAPSKTKYHSEPLPTPARKDECPGDISKSGPVPACKLPRQGKLENFQMFRTKSERFNPSIQKNFSRLQSRMLGTAPESPEKPGRGSGVPRPRLERSIPAGRYFAALQGPELEDLKECEEVLLPLDQEWPFLLRFPISSFGISLGLGSQTILWKSIDFTSSTHLLHIPKLVNLVLWCSALFALIMVFSTYTLKCIFYFEAVRREFQHPVRVNFFFAPWIAAMFLTIGASNYCNFNPPCSLVCIHDTTVSVRAQDLWPMAIWRLEKVIQGGQSVYTLVHCREFYWSYSWGNSGVERASRLSLGSWPCSLLGCFCYSLSEAAHK
ncbi:hypothetical protein O6H91_14G066200 [Diphasiastrum complanatum]|uniref:Uncharacterized protein n=1 Tax=Diphasiastrum complanatum TaxID=34168 RepID=A0ACC2BQ80_DIPCM|nr:hypothetical protein O6H91_14G066200 [Diphasiastrum complanatum]